MKRTGAVCLALTLLGGAFVFPAGAAKAGPKKVTRKAAVTYENPALGSASGIGGGACLPCPTLSAFRSERWISVDVTDDVSPNPVAFEIRQSTTDGRCCEEVAGPFCGSTGKQPVEITPGLDVFIFVFATGDITCPGAFGTTGTVTAVFSNAP